MTTTDPNSCSFWQNVIPKLQVQGKESETFRRHLQDQQRNGIFGTKAGGSNDVAFFEKISLKFSDNLKPAPDPSSDSIRTGSLHDSPGVVEHNNKNIVSPNNSSSQTTSNVSLGHQPSNSNRHQTKGKTTIVSYLYPTLGIGFTLVSINIIVFLLLYLKMRHAVSKRRSGRSNRRNQSLNESSVTEKEETSRTNYAQSNASSLSRRSNNGLHYPSNSLRRTSFDDSSLSRGQGIQEQQQATQDLHTSPAHSNRDVYSLHPLQPQLDRSEDNGSHSFSPFIPTPVQSLSYPIVESGYPCSFHSQQHLVT